MIDTLLGDFGLVFTVFYAVASCGLVLLNLLNIQYKQSFNFAMMQGVVSLVLMAVLFGSEYGYVYNYIAILSCFTSVIIALFGGSIE